jgi:hypothetical protein
MFRRSDYRLCGRRVCFADGPGAGPLQEPSQCVGISQNRRGSAQRLLSFRASDLRSAGRWLCTDAVAAFLAPRVPIGARAAEATKLNHGST